MGSPELEKDWAKLMDAALDGDRDAYRRFFASVTPFLRFVARRRGAGLGLEPHEAEDIVQETLLALHIKRHTWDAKRPIGPWIMAIARNKLVDARRRRGRKELQYLEAVAGVYADPAYLEPGNGGDLDRLMEKLTDRERALVKLMSIDGRSSEEAGRQLNMSTGAARVALHRALKKLAAFYREDEP